MALKKEVTRTEEKTSHKEFSDQATLSAHQLIKSISYVPVEKAGNTALSLSFMIHLLSMHSAKDDYSIVRNIPFLVGPPGTGKTYFAEVLASNVIANLAAILRNDEQASDIAQLLDEARSSGLIPEKKFRTIEKVVRHFNNKAMEKLISEVLIKYNEATAKGKEKLSRSFYAFILDLYSNREVGIPTSVEVSTTIF
ncbi:MAG: AAA family ATPase, partial [Methanobacteriota archaeon]